MRIFLTGASGYLGSAVLDACVRAGHSVTGLVRNSEKAAYVTERGGHPVIGTLGNPASYQQAARGHDAYLLAAFEPSARGPEIDRITIETILAVAKGPRGGSRQGAGVQGPAVVVYTSGIWVIGNAPVPADETAPLDPTPLVAWRPQHEQLVLEASAETLRTVVLRPGIV